MEGKDVKVIVCGSRGWRDRGKIRAQLTTLPKSTTIVVGYNPAKGTPKGADEIAYQEAEKLGLEVEWHPALWKTHGKSAGAIRNGEMAKSGAALCLAFWDGDSRGTKNMIEQATRNGIAVRVIYA